MSRRPEGAPKRWTQGGAHDEISRRAAALFSVPPPAALGSARREQIARRLAGSAVHAHVALPILAKATGIVAVAGGIAFGVVRYTSTPAQPRQAESGIVAPSPAARPSPATPVTAPPDRGPARVETAPASAPQGSSIRSDRGRGSTKIANISAARPSRASGSGHEVQPSPQIPSVPVVPGAPSPASIPPQPSAEPALAPQAPTAYAMAAPQSEHHEAAPAQEEAPVPPPTRSEPRLLADALASLHAREDAKGALALLAEHRRRFPHGALRSEARVAEIEALLSLDRRTEALRILDDWVIERMPRSSSLSVLRAELRAQAGRCAEAIADFDRCTAAHGCRSELQERALFGRASCRRKLGQAVAARADLERYLLRFPHGWRSEAVRRVLAEER